MKERDLIDEVTEEYAKAFPEAPILWPFGVGDEDRASAMQEAIRLGRPIPHDYDWYAHLPPDAVA